LYAFPWSGGTTDLGMEVASDCGMDSEREGRVVDLSGAFENGEIDIVGRSCEAWMGCGGVNGIFCGVGDCIRFI